MLKNERHNQILQILEKNRYAGVQELSTALFASPPTIRRDLTFLENNGYVIRSHGGVMLRDEQTDTPVAFRSSTMTRQKMRISRTAAELIAGDHPTVFIDASTTASYIATSIARSGNVTVVTNGLRVCEALADSEVAVYATGGKLLQRSLAFVGQPAIDYIDRFNLDIIFFSSSALGLDGVIQDYSLEETELRREVLKSNAKKVFLCDSTKFGRSNTFRVCRLTDVDAIITDAPLPDSIEATSHFSLQEKEDSYLYTKTQETKA